MIKSKRTILFCIGSLGGGGAEKLLIDVLRRIDHQLFTVDLCVTSGQGLYMDNIPKQVHLVDYEYFRQVEYDVEVAFLEGFPTQQIALRQSAAVKIAWIHTDLYNNHYTIGSAYNSASEEAVCYSLMDQIIFVSQNGMKQFDRLYPGANVNKRVIYNLIDKEGILSKSEAFECPIEKTKLTLCSIGRLWPVKGFDRLIPVLSRLKKDGLDFHYWMIGDGPQKGLILNLIEQHDLKDTVLLPGFHKNPHPYLKASDVFVSVSLVEGLPLVIGEALCLGKPVVATNVPGTAELLGHGKYGMLVETDDESVYRGLKEMLSDESLRASYAKKAETGSMIDIFDIQKNINQINDLLYHAKASTKTPLDRIAHHIFIDNNTSNNPGLLYGKMGKAIFFFHYSALTGNKIYEDYALDLIEEMTRLIYQETPVDYENGLAGIGVAIEYLSQHQFIEGSTNEILENFDRKLRKETLKAPSNFSLLNGYMGYARYWMFRLNSPENKTIHKNSRIIKSLNYILSVIDIQMSDIESDTETQDVYRFLCDLRQFPQFTQQADSRLNKYFENKYFDEHVRHNFGYTKSNPVNKYIWNCFQGIGDHVHNDEYTNLNQLTDIIRDELFVLTFNQQDNSSALRPVALKTQHSRTQPKSNCPDIPIVDVHTHPRKMSDVVNFIKVSEAVRQGYGANLAFWIGLTPPPEPVAEVKAACNNRMLLAVDEMKPQKGLTVTAEEVIAKMREGYVGLKFWFGNPQRDKENIIIRIDDPGYENFFTALERESVLMTSLHIADPNGPFTDRREWMPDPVCFWTQIKAFENMVAKYSKLTIIAAHGAWLLCQDAQIDHLRYMLSAYPNLHIDLAATFQYIPLVNRDNLRDFYIEYQDRILYGTDAGDIPDESIDYYAKRYVNTFMILETNRIVNGGFFGNTPTKGFNLPREVLEKIYYKNALKLYPGLKLMVSD